MQGYCMRCKEKKEIKDPVACETKNGKPMVKGKCPDCGAVICRVGASR